MSLLLPLLLLLHAAISLMNTVLQHTSRSEQRDLADDGDAAAKRFLALTDDSLRLSMTVSLAHILTRFAFAAALMWLLLDSVSPGDEAARLLIVLAAVALGAGATLILGDLAPEAVGGAYADALLPFAIRPMRWLTLLMSPLTWLVWQFSRLISRLLGSKPLTNIVTEEEILTLVSAGHSGGAIETDEKDMIHAVLQLGDSNARELMTPRQDIVALDVKSDIMAALDAFVASGFSRIPVYEGGIDQVIGLLIAKDILTLLKKRDDLAAASIRDLMRPPYFVPETRRADALLKEMQAQNMHLALVVDEYGGTAGLITIENLIEEIIGDIRDEYDMHEEEEFVELGDGAWLIDASIDLDDLNSLLDCAIDSAVTDTLGGYIYLLLGRVPLADETIRSDVLRMTVKSIEGHRIRQVEVRKMQPDDAPASAKLEPMKAHVHSNGS